MASKQTTGIQGYNPNNTPLNVNQSSGNSVLSNYSGALKSTGSKNSDLSNAMTAGLNVTPAKSNVPLTKAAQAIAGNLIKYTPTVAPVTKPAVQTKASVSDIPNYTFPKSNNPNTWGNDSVSSQIANLNNENSQPDKNDLLDQMRKQIQQRNDVLNKIYNSQMIDINRQNEERLNQQRAIQAAAGNLGTEQASSAIDATNRYNNQQVQGTNAQYLEQGNQIAQQALDLYKPQAISYGTNLVNPYTGQATYETMPTDNTTAISDALASGTLLPNMVSRYTAPYIANALTQNPNVNLAQNAANYGVNKAIAQNIGTTYALNTAQSNTIQQNYSSLLDMMNQYKINNTKVPIINTIKNNIKKGILGDEALHAFDNSIITLRGEYAKFIGGGTSSVETLREAQKAIPDNISLAQMEAVYQRMLHEQENQLGSYGNVFNNLQQQSVTQPTSASQSSFNTFANSWF